MVDIDGPSSMARMGSSFASSCSFAVFSGGEKDSVEIIIILMLSCAGWSLNISSLAKALASMRGVIVCKDVLQYLEKIMIHAPFYKIINTAITKQ